MQLAKILLEQGDASEAERLAHSAAEAFDREKATDLGCTSDAILGRAQLAQGKVKEAQTTTDVAVALCERAQDWGARFGAAIASASVKFKAGHVEDALHLLEWVHAESSRKGYLAYELEGELLRGKIEVTSGQSSAGRSRLKGVQKKAQTKNFGLIAREAQQVFVRLVRSPAG